MPQIEITFAIQEIRDLRGATPSIAQDRYILPKGSEIGVKAAIPAIPGTLVQVSTVSTDRKSVV